jgi:peptidoglycan/LPS O-acetylase OafA/YrhL
VEPVIWIKRQLDRIRSPSSKYHSAFVAQKGDDPVLDGLRGISILMVILFHSFYGAAFALKDLGRIQEFLRSVPEILGFVFTTEKAVDIFFMVSGYLLGKSLFQEIQRNGTIDRRKFYIRRLFRICPLFYIALLLYAPINLNRSFNNLIYNLLFIDNFWGKMIIPVGWSLSIEMQFYFVLPFLIAFLHNKPNPAKWLWAGFGFSFLIQALVCLMIPDIFSNPFSSFMSKKVDPNIFMVHYYYPTHVRFGPLLMGLLWAHYSLHSSNSPGLQRLRQPIIGGLVLSLSMFALIVCSYYPSYSPDSYFNLNFDPKLNFVAMVLHRNTYALGLFGILLMVHVLKGERGLTGLIHRILAQSFWRPFSQAVFPMYLFQFPMIAVAGIMVFGTTNIKAMRMLNFAEVILIFIIASALTLVLGLFLHANIEKPLIARGQRIANRNRKM